MIISSLNRLIHMLVLSFSSIHITTISSAKKMGNFSTVLNNHTPTSNPFLSNITQELWALILCPEHTNYYLFSSQHWSKYKLPYSNAIPILQVRPKECLIFPAKSFFSLTPLVKHDLSCTFGVLGGLEEESFQHYWDKIDLFCKLKGITCWFDKLTYSKITIISFM